MRPLMYPLKEVVYNHNARGPWCAIPYHGHPHGCPNLKSGCTTLKATDFALFGKDYDWFAVVEEFDLKSHAEKMKKRHPEWTERQCRNLLYWQGSVKKNLLEKSKSVSIQFKGSVILTIPEACGVEVFETMARVGVILERTPDTVRKVMLVGVPK